MNKLKWITDLEELSKNETIKESEILALIPEDTIPYWDIFMRGKTCPLLENGDHGVYGWDLKQFLKWGSWSSWLGFKKIFG
jgi:hypothetical protein